MAERKLAVVWGRFRAARLSSLVGLSFGRLLFLGHSRRPVRELFGPWVCRDTVFPLCTAPLVFGRAQEGCTVISLLKGLVIEPPIKGIKGLGAWKSDFDLGLLTQGYGGPALAK